MKTLCMLTLTILLPFTALEAGFRFGYSSDGRVYFGAGRGYNNHQPYRNQYYYRHGRQNYYNRHNYNRYNHRRNDYYNRPYYQQSRYRCDSNGNCRKVYMRYRW